MPVDAITALPMASLGMEKKKVWAIGRLEFGFRWTDGELRNSGVGRKSVRANGMYCRDRE